MWCSLTFHRFPDLALWLRHRIRERLGFRIDARLNDKHNAFIRYRDGNATLVRSTPVPPSNFVSNKNWVDQYLLGVTSVLRPNVINDFRFSFGYWQNRNIPAPCSGDVNGNCIGAGGPEVFYLNSVNFALGNNFNSPQGRDLRRFPISDNVSWQLGSHRVKFGGEWEHFTGTGYWGFSTRQELTSCRPSSFSELGYRRLRFPPSVCR
jgi:hypothetical protein